MKRFPYLWVTAVVIVLDQVSKFLIRNVVDFGPDHIIRITPTFFWLTHVQNEAAAFSFSLGRHLHNIAPSLIQNPVAFDKMLHVIVTIIACGAIYFFAAHTKRRAEKLALALILGGALGNFIDRITIGSVTDFIWWDFPDFLMERWPVFNIADSSIVIAITIYAVWTIFFEKKNRRKHE